MDDYAGLIERLQQMGDRDAATGERVGTGGDPIFHQAATAISTLVAERDEHDGIVAVWRRRTITAETALADALAKLAAAEGALRGLWDHCCRYMPGKHWRNDLPVVAQVRAALTSGKQEAGGGDE